MTIVHLITSLEAGGAQAVLYATVAKCKQYGIKNYVAYTHDGPYKEKFTALDIPLIHVPYYKLICPLFFPYLLYTLRIYNPTLLVGHLWLGGIYAKLITYICGIKAVIVLHNLASHNGGVRSLIDRILPKKLITVIAVSSLVAESFTNIYPLICVINNGINPKVLHAQATNRKEQRKKLQIADNDHVWGTVGRLTAVKNQSALIQAFKKHHSEHPMSHLIIVGSGPELTTLQKIITTHNITQHVHIIDEFPAYPWYSTFDCFIQLATNDAGIPLVLLEAGIYKIPLIALSWDQRHHLIEDGVNGILIQNDDEDTIIKAFKDIHSNYEKYKSFTEATYKKIYTLFHEDIMSESYVKTFLQLLNKKQPRKIL